MKKTITFFVLMFGLASFVLSQTPQYYNFNSGGTANTIPFGSSGVSGYRSQWLLMPNAYNNPVPVPPGNKITKLYIRGVASSSPIVCTNLKIRLGQTTDTVLSTTGAFTGPMDSVYFKAFDTVTTNSSGYAIFTLQTPYNYNPSLSLVIEISHCGFTGTGFSVYQYTALPNKRTNSPGTPSCVFTWSSTDARTIHSGVDVVPASVFYYNYMTGLNANSFPLGIAAGKMVQWLVLASEFNQPSSAPSGSISKFAFRVPTGYPLNSATYTSLYIRFGLTTITSLTSGAFHTGPMDTVYRRASVTLSAPADSWLEFVLDQPFLYNPTQSLVIEMGHCSGAGATGFPLAHTILTGNRRVWSIGGCPFAPYAGAGTNVLNCGVWISTVTNKTPNTSQIPNEYKLEQNYPNPFNPVTKINFALPKAGFVSLKIYDILGREVVNLVNENRVAGSHTVDFDASALTSGAYFYRLESKGFADTKKMILLK